MQTMHSLLMQHEKQARTMETNPEKLMDKYKKLATNLDLTSQRCQKYESEIHQMRGRPLTQNHRCFYCLFCLQCENTLFAGLRDKMDEVLFQKNNLTQQLRESEHQCTKAKDELDRLRQSCSAYQVQLSQNKLQADLLQDHLDQVISTICFLFCYIVLYFWHVFYNSFVIHRQRLRKRS